MSEEQQRDKRGGAVVSQATLLAAALAELVALKDLKERFEKIDPLDLSAPRNYYAEELREEYERRKGPAWTRARAALETSPSHALEIDDPFCWYIVQRDITDEYTTVYSEQENCPGPGWKPLYEPAKVPCERSTSGAEEGTTSPCPGGAPSTVARCTKCGGCKTPNLPASCDCAPSTTPQKPGNPDLTAKEIEELQPAVIKLLKEATFNYACLDEAEFLNQVDCLFVMARRTLSAIRENGWTKMPDDYTPSNHGHRIMPNFVERGQKRTYATLADNGRWYTLEVFIPQTPNNSLDGGKQT